MMKTRIFIKVDGTETAKGCDFKLHNTVEYAFKLTPGDYVMFADRKYVVIMIEHNLTPSEVSQDIFLQPWQKESL